MVQNLDQKTWWMKEKVLDSKMKGKTFVICSYCVNPVFESRLLHMC